MRLSLQPSDQPVLRLSYFSRACRSEIRVNDVPVFRNTGGQAVHAEIPVNEWLFRGVNQFSLHLFPAELVDESSAGLPGSAAGIFSRAARARLALSGRRSGTPHRSAEELGVIEYTHLHDAAALDHPSAPPAAPMKAQAAAAASPAVANRRPDDEPFALSEVELSWSPAQGIVILTRRFNLPAVWPACPWLNARPMDDIKAAAYSASRMNRLFWDTLKRRDRAGVLRFLDRRRAALQTAYRIGPQEADEILLPAAWFSAQNPDALTLIEVPHEPELFGGGRLVSSFPFGTPNLAVRLKDTPPLESSLSLLWMQDASGIWQLI